MRSVQVWEGDGVDPNVPKPDICYSMRYEDIETLRKINTAVKLQLALGKEVDSRIRELGEFFTAGSVCLTRHDAAILKNLLGRCSATKLVTLHVWVECHVLYDSLAVALRCTIDQEHGKVDTSL